MSAVELEAKTLRELAAEAVERRRAIASPTPPAELPPGLDAIDRMLLSGDGTVTVSLRACTGEPVVTAPMRESGPATLERLVEIVGRWWHPDAGLLEADAGEELIARRTVIRGAWSGVPYVLAESLLAPARLPDVMAGGLRRVGSSIGRLLVDHRIESRREIVAIGRMRAGENASLLAVDAGESLAWRTYRIVVRGRPAIVLTELVVPGRLSDRAASSR